VAEWLRSGLQSRVHRFDSGRRLGTADAASRVRDDVDVAEPHVPEHHDVTENARFVLGEAAFPVYGIAGWSGGSNLTGHRGSRSGIYAVTLGHGVGPTVTTTCARPGRNDERLQAALRSLAANRPDPANRRADIAEAIAASVVLHDVSIPVSGTPRPFTLGACGEGWAALGVLEPARERTDGRELTVLIEARHGPFAPLALVEKRRD
jgi:hypothetical protein